MIHPNKYSSMKTTEATIACIGSKPVANSSQSVGPPEDDRKTPKGSSLVEWATSQSCASEDGCFTLLRQNWIFMETGERFKQFFFYQERSVLLWWHGFLVLFIPSSLRTKTWTRTKEMDLFCQVKWSFYFELSLSSAVQTMTERVSITTFQQSLRIVSTVNETFFLRFETSFESQIVFFCRPRPCSIFCNFIVFFSKRSSKCFKKISLKFSTP